MKKKKIVFDGYHHGVGGEEEMLNNQYAFKNLVSNKLRKHKLRRIDRNHERIKAVKIK